jgi:hypothetical protein
MGSGRLMKEMEYCHYCPPLIEYFCAVAREFLSGCITCALGGAEKETGGMSVHKWLSGIRLFLGFLLAPAVVCVSLGTTLDRALAQLGAHPDGPANIMLGSFVFIAGLLVPYLGAWGFGLPYYAVVMLGRGRVGFLAVMIPTLIVSLVYALMVYSSLCDFHPPHPLAENVAVPQVPAVILSGVCFYLIGVWKPYRRFCKASGAGE